MRQRRGRCCGALTRQRNPCDSPTFLLPHKHVVGELVCCQATMPLCLNQITPSLIFPDRCPRSCDGNASVSVCEALQSVNLFRCRRTIFVPDAHSEILLIDQRVGV